VRVHTHRDGPNLTFAKLALVEFPTNASHRMLALLIVVVAHWRWRSADIGN
jgi:hypothetical protein